MSRKKKVTQRKGRRLKKPTQIEARPATPNAESRHDSPFICRGCDRSFQSENDFREHVIDSGHVSFYFRRDFGTRIAV